MFISEQIVSIIFRIINFTVFVSLAVYLFKKYALTFIQKKIAEREAYTKGIIKQKKELEAEYHNIDNQIDDQEKLGKELLKKIGHWRHVFEDDLISQEKEKESLRVILEGKIRTQAEQMSTHYIQQQVLSSAIAQARQALIHMFDQEKQGRPFLQDLIKHIKRRYDEK